MFKKISKMGIKKKLDMGYNIVILFMMISGIVSIIGLAILNDNVNDFVNKVNVADTAVKFCRIDINIAARNVREMALNSDTSQYASYKTTIDEKLTSLEERLAQLKATGIVEDAKYNEYEAAIMNWTSIGLDIVDMIESGKQAEATKAILTECAPALEQVIQLSQLLDEETNVAMDEKIAVCQSIFILSIILIVAFVVIAAAMAKKLGFTIVQSIIEPVEQIERAAGSLRVGDLSVADQITYESDDELGSLAKTMRESISILDGYVKEIVENFEKVASGDLTKDFSEITDFLGDFGSIKNSFMVILREFNSTLSNIAETAAHVDKGSDEIAGAANDLAVGTGEQASAVEELTATIETVSSMADQAAKQAQEEFDSMMKSVEEAQKERRQMQELKEEMLRIKEISNQIESIVTAIEEIASQTSLLSLNASIEAARAGEAGRGFAVVADQIGKLATDSAQAVVSTKELIGKTIEEIDHGNKITEATAAGFERIIKELEMFAEAAKSNSEVSKTQSQSLMQVEEGVNQISIVTEQNAAASEECSAIGEELAARASELEEMVRKFKLF